MRIATFGCSWTHGVNTVDNNYSWPEAISEKNKDLYVHNYALGGSSLSFQLFCMTEVLRHKSYDKIIFQFTVPGRLTYFPEDCDVLKWHRNYTGNYSRFNHDDGMYRTINCITKGHSSLPKRDSFWTTKEKYNLMKSYYGNMPKEIYRTEYTAMLEYIEKRVDLCFFHNEDILKFDKFAVINEEVKQEGGQILLDSFIADNGEHYNKAGCKWIADWVLEKI